MTTAADLLRTIAEIQLDGYVSRALDVLKDSDGAPEVKKWVNQAGTARIELALCEAYIELLMKRRDNLRNEIGKYRKKKF